MAIKAGLAVTIIAVQAVAQHQYEEHKAYYMDHMREYKLPTSGEALSEEHPILAKRSHIMHDYQGKTIVIGHRGGKFGPDNSMETFRAAIKHSLEGIEFDVWLTKDNELVLMHGGVDGDLDDYGYHTDRVFEWTKEEVQSRIQLSNSEIVPSLEDVIALTMDSPRMLLNIELKGPMDPECFAEYDFKILARKAIKLIDKYGVGYRTMISSFNPLVMDALAAEKSDSGFLLQSLRNPWGLDDVLDYATPSPFTGINIEYTQMKPHRIAKNHQDKRLVGVWWSAWASAEDALMWHNVFTAEERPDFFYSDHALDAVMVRDAFQI